MISPSLTAVIQVYYHERREYLPRIIDALLRGSLVPSRIIVWDNGGRGMWTADPNVQWISSERNTLMGRWACVLLAETDVVVVCDDDLIPGRTAIEELVTARSGDLLVGAFGSRLKRDSDNPYTEGHAVHDGLCDVVLGRLLCASRATIIDRLSWAITRNLAIDRCDDIVLSMANPKRNYVVPVEVTNLEEGSVGLCHDAVHFTERNLAAHRFLRYSLSHDLHDAINPSNLAELREKESKGNGSLHREQIL